jgi:hypothetical protein
VIARTEIKGKQLKLKDMDMTLEIDQTIKRTATVLAKDDLCLDDPDL